MMDKMKILVGLDGSDSANRALSEAVTIAKKFSGSIKVISVYNKGMEKKAEEIVDIGRQLCAGEEIKCSTSTILGSNPARALQDMAKNEQSDLIVVGSRGLGSAASILLGSVSRQIIANAECNVLVIKK